MSDSMERELFTPNRLFCPGPTPSPWSIKQAGLDSDVYHRSKEFEAIVRSCIDLLKPLYGTKTDPVIFTASGTGAMESVVVNLTEPNDSVMVVVAGKFGERWQKLNETYGNKVTVIPVEWGRAPTTEAVESALKKGPLPKVFFMQANETSTGARFDVGVIAKVIKKHSPETLIVVDAISSLGAHAVNMDLNGIDAVTGGSQKGFGVAPGLSFVALSERAWGRLSTRSKYYFDLNKERLGQASGRTAWTPAVSLMQSLQVSLQEIHRIGVESFAAHHQRMSRACRAAVKALGLELFVEDRAASDALTAIKVPAGLDGTAILVRAKTKYGAIISGGQDDLKGRIIRFSHLGFVGPFMLIEGLAALEFALADCGHKFKLGAGVSAAMDSLYMGTPD
jgi:aspartate aminotransferase-like enzyme